MIIVKPLEIWQVSVRFEMVKLDDKSNEDLAVFWWVVKDLKGGIREAVGTYASSKHSSKGPCRPPWARPASIAIVIEEIVITVGGKFCFFL